MEHNCVLWVQCACSIRDIKLGTVSKSIVCFNINTLAYTCGFHFYMIKPNTLETYIRSINNASREHKAVKYTLPHKVSKLRGSHPTNPIFHFIINKNIFLDLSSFHLTCICLIYIYIYIYINFFFNICDEVMWSIDSKVTQLHLVKHLKLRMIYIYIYIYYFFLKH